MLVLPDSSTYPKHQRRFSIGLTLAIFAHVLLLVSLPDLPKMTFSVFNRDGGINVFLSSTPEPKEEVFEQTLNQANPSPNSNQPLLEPAPSSSSLDPSEQELVSDETPKVAAQSGESNNPKGQGEQAPSDVNASILISRSLITAFARQEAVAYANNRPDELKRFKRRFNSYRSYQRRNRLQGFQNQYGDYYARAASSSGDVCFKQERYGTQDDFSAKTVYFFRCDQAPKKFKIDSAKLDKSSE